MRMSERTHGNATAKIQITFPVCIPNMAPLAALQHEIEPRIRGHNVLFEQLANAISRVSRELLSRFRGSCFHRGYVLLSLFHFHLLFRKSCDITAWFFANSVWRDSLKETTKHRDNFNENGFRFCDLLF